VTKVKLSLAVGGCVLLALVLAACGGSGDGASSGVTSSPSMTAVRYVTSAAQRTTTAPSEHVDLDATVTAAGKTVELKGSGDFARTEGMMHMEGVGTEGASVDAILNGTTIYMKSPAFASSLPAGKSWVKIDLQRAGAANGIDFSSLLSQSPTQSLAHLEASGPVSKVGVETIGNEPTTHYRGFIDLTKLPQGRQIEALTNVRYGPYDVWIGRDGYVYRMRLAYSYEVPQSGRAEMTMDMKLSNFGEQVNVGVPSDDETLDLTGMATGAGG
jgi:hypothetical protein